MVTGLGPGSSGGRNRDLVPAGSDDHEDNTDYPDELFNQEDEGGIAGNIIFNYDFSNGLENWQPTGIRGYIASSQTDGTDNYLKGVPPTSTGKPYAVIANREEAWQGLEQDITSRVLVGVEYKVTACVRVYGGSLTAEDRAKVEASLRLEYNNSKPIYPLAGSAYVSTQQWENLVGRFTVETEAMSVVFYLEGPKPGVVLLVDSVVVSPVVSPAA